MLEGRVSSLEKGTKSFRETAPSKVSGPKEMGGSSKSVMVFSEFVEVFGKVNESKLIATLNSELLSLSKFVAEPLFTAVRRSKILSLS